MAKQSKKRAYITLKLPVPNITKRHMRTLLTLYLVCSNLVLQGMVLHEKVHLGVFPSNMVENEVSCSLKVT
jgi:hypothetical protein